MWEQYHVKSFGLQPCTYRLIYINLYSLHSGCDTGCQYCSPQVDYIRGHEECETNLTHYGQLLQECNPDIFNALFSYLKMIECESKIMRRKCVCAGVVCWSTPAASRQSREVWQNFLCSGKRDDFIWETLLGGKRLRSCANHLVRSLIVYNTGTDRINMLYLFWTGGGWREDGLGFGCSQTISQQEGDGSSYS